MYTNRVNVQQTKITQDRTDVHMMKVQTSEIEERLQSAEILLHTMFRLLRKKGLTDEEFDNELDIVTKLHIEKRNAFPEITCPKCGKLMQIGNITSTTANCMYCGTTKTFSPFAKYEKEEVDETPVEDQEINIEEQLGF